MRNFKYYILVLSLIHAQTAYSAWNPTAEYLDKIHFQGLDAKDPMHDFDENFSANMDEFDTSDDLSPEQSTPFSSGVTLGDVSDNIINQTILEMEQDSDDALDQMLLQMYQEIDQDIRQSAPQTHFININRRSLALFDAIRNNNQKSIKQMLYRGVNPNDSIGEMTPLTVATMNNNNAIVDILLKKGANPDQAGKNGLTPLMVAAYHGNVVIVTQLLTMGANPCFTNENQLTALDFARSDNDIIALLKGCPQYREISPTSIQYNLSMNNFNDNSAAASSSK